MELPMVGSRMMGRWWIVMILLLVGLCFGRKLESRRALARRSLAEKGFTLVRKQDTSRCPLVIGEDLYQEIRKFCDSATTIYDELESESIVPTELPYDYYQYERPDDKVLRAQMYDGMLTESQAPITPAVHAYNMYTHNGIVPGLQVYNSFDRQLEPDTGSEILDECLTFGTSSSADCCQIAHPFFTACIESFFLADKEWDSVRGRGPAIQELFNYVVLHCDGAQEIETCTNMFDLYSFIDECSQLHPFETEGCGSREGCCSTAKDFMNCLMDKQSFQVCNTCTNIGSTYLDYYDAVKAPDVCPDITLPEPMVAMDRNGYQCRGPSFRAEQDECRCFDELWAEDKLDQCRSSIINSAAEGAERTRVTECLQLFYFNPGETQEGTYETACCDVAERMTTCLQEEYTRCQSIYNGLFFSAAYVLAYQEALQRKVCQLSFQTCYDVQLLNPEASFVKVDRCTATVDDANTLFTNATVTACDSARLQLTCMRDLFKNCAACSWGHFYFNWLYEEVLVECAHEENQQTLGEVTRFDDTTCPNIAATDIPKDPDSILTPELCQKIENVGSESPCRCFSTTDVTQGVENCKTSVLEDTEEPDRTTASTCLETTWFNQTVWGDRNYAQSCCSTMEKMTTCVTTQFDGCPMDDVGNFTSAGYVVLYQEALESRHCGRPDSICNNVRSFTMDGIFDDYIKCSNATLANEIFTTQNSTILRNACEAAEFLLDCLAKEYFIDSCEDGCTWSPIYYSRFYNDFAEVCAAPLKSRFIAPVPWTDTCPAVGQENVTEPDPSNEIPPTEETPGESPPGDDGDGICFPATAEVTLEDGKKKPMKEVELGDRLLVGSGTYSDVFAFTHRLEKVESKFVQIRAASGHTIELSPSHYLPVNSLPYVAAENVRVGDTLKLGDGSTTVVLETQIFTGEGLYNPQTLHGDIVVNGVVASTYTRTIHPTVAHLLLWLPRSLYRLGVKNPLANIFDDSVPAYVRKLLPKGP